MFKSKSHGVTVVHADTLSFVSTSGSDLQVDHSIPLAEFLADDFESASIPAHIRNRQNRLLIVPDYWCGQTSLSLPSRKRSVVEPFIERNLASEHPDLPGIGLFYNYAFLKSRSEEGNILVIFLQEPASYQLYQTFDALKMAPFDITTPAYIWGKKIEIVHPDSVDSGIGLIQKLPTASYLYFYHQEQFLFSRSIQASETSTDDTDVLNALTYEINQSVYLFSQKKKADLEYIYIDSPREADGVELSESLGRSVQNFGDDQKDSAHKQVMADELGPCGVFSPGDLAPARKFLAIAQKDHAKAREWRPVQLAGVLIGLLMYLILGVEYYYLLRWSKQEVAPEIAANISGQSSREVIEQYNSSLDLVLNENRRKSSWRTMINLAKCLPENVQIKRMQIDLAEAPAVNLRCVIHAVDMTEFRSSLRLLLDEIAQTFVGSSKIEARDVELGQIRQEQEYTQYPITFTFRL